MSAEEKEWAKLGHFRTKGKNFKGFVLLFRKICLAIGENIIYNDLAIIFVQQGGTDMDKHNNAEWKAQKKAYKTAKKKAVL